MRRKNKKFYILFILIVLFGVSVGYAAISRALTINGNSEVKQNTWDIHFENVQIKNGSVTATKEPTLENSNTSVNFSFMLALPGDYYEFTVDAVNRGTIDAMIDSITKTPELTTEQAKYLNYIIEYQNGEQISSKQLVSKNSFVRIKVRVEYRTDLTENDLPTTNQSLDLGFTLNYVQADSTGTSVKDNGVLIVSNRSLDDIGTIVTIGDQQFYTIGTEGENVKLLSMYNLYVGNQCDDDNGPVPLTSPTGKQSETAIGWFNGYNATNPVIGSTPFSDTSSTYEGSIVEGYVNAYKEILEGEEYGIDIVEARLITKDELTDSETFACVEYDYCPNKYPWIYSTSYWSGSATNTNIVLTVTSDGHFDIYGYSYVGSLGVRPVIVLKKSDIVVNEIKPVANGSLDDIGTIVTIGSEQFYTIGTEGDNVKLLSMYNLYVGNQYDLDNGVVALASPTGRQSEIARGFFMEYSAENPIIGITPFSSAEQKGTNYSDYNGSIVEGYVNNYKDILENDYNVDVVEARLITKDELTDSETFACVEYYCSNKYPWIYSTTYYSGSAVDEDLVWGIYNYGSFDTFEYGDHYSCGVRPVIVISKSYF